jgi:hypothetical protein
MSRPSEAGLRYALPVHSPLELADIDIRAGFVHDAAGRLTAINDIGGGRPPLVQVTRTVAGAVVRLGAHAPAALAAEVESFAATLLAPSVEGDTAHLEALKEIVARHATIGHATAGPVFIFPPPTFPAPGAMQIYPANAVLLHPELATWGPELRERKPAFGVIRDGQVIAICASSRTTPLAAEAGVETVTAFRGQGAAGLAAAAWGAAVHETGRVAFYSTSWENVASRAVAAKLELDFLAESLSVY